jgi:chromosome segregation ATPase
MSEGVKDFFNTHGKDLAMLAVVAVGAYFTIQANVKDIADLKLKDAEIEANKVGNSTMILKEQYLSSELGRIEEEINDLNTRLDKKIKIISAQQTEIHLLNVQISVQEALINQGISERANIWQNYNRINCK